VVLLVVGAAWNLAQGIRERAAAQEADKHADHRPPPQFGFLFDPDFSYLLR
jgi:hypothetical protein